MSMLEAATSYCAAMFQQYAICRHCTHPSGRCSGSCRDCSEQVNYHKDGGRTDYDCQNFMYYYTCRYSWKYCSEILYAMEQIDSSRYPAYNILSLGCGGAPDLMAFEMRFPEADGKSIAYTGYDANPYWQIIHALIYGYAQARGIAARFLTQNIFAALDDEKTELHSFNIIILQYLISHFQPDGRSDSAERLFAGLINKILRHPARVSPTLFLLNDIDHSDIRNCYALFLRKLSESGYSATIIIRRHFKEREYDYGDDSTQHVSQNNKFSIPETIKTKFDCAIRCTSAQLIVEVN